MPIRLRCARLVGLAVLLSACAVTTRSGDPFAEAGNTQRASGRLYRVRLEAVCAGCTVTYSFAARATSVVPATPVWRATFDRYPRFPEAVRLSASGEVESVRIYVDGELVASQERRAAAAYATLSVEAVVPPDAPPPEPDTLDVEGR
jgi:hypothetical protein